MEDESDIIAPLIIGVIVIIAIGWIFLYANRPQRIYQEETNRLVEQQSARRIEGINSNIANLCLQIKTNKDLVFKKAISEQLITDASKVDAKFITQPNEQCLVLANQIIGE